MDNWTAPKYNIIQHTIYSSVVANFYTCIPLSKREAKIRNQAGFFVFDKFTFTTSHERTQRLFTGSTIPSRDVFSAGNESDLIPFNMSRSSKVRKFSFRVLDFRYIFLIFISRQNKLVCAQRAPKKNHKVCPTSSPPSGDTPAW